MAYCTKGHYFDSGAHAECPQCAAARSAAPRRTQYREGPAAHGQPASPPAVPQRPWGGPPVSPFGVGQQRSPGGPPAASPPRTVWHEADAAPERLMGFLVITAAKEEEEWRYLRLRKGVNSIGRFGSRNTIELRDSQASTEHVLLACTNSATRLIDLDSTNGVFVNGARQEFAELEEGDVIRIGRTELTYVSFPFVADD